MSYIKFRCADNSAEYYFLEDVLKLSERKLRGLQKLVDHRQVIGSDFEKYLTENEYGCMACFFDRDSYYLLGDKKSDVRFNLKQYLFTKKLENIMEEEK